MNSEAKVPWMLKAFTHSDNTKMLKMFRATAENISLETLQNCTDEDHPFEGLGHGDIIGEPERMAREIQSFLES